jgi:hypothetical protein
MKKVVSMFMAAAVVLSLGIAQAKAAESKPIAALAVASYNDVLDDVNFVGNLIERPQLGTGMEGLVTLATQAKGLAGIDKTRPSGVIVQASGDGNPTGYAFVPVSDFKAALDLMKLFFTTKTRDGLTYQLTPKNGRQVLYVKQQGTWAFVSDKPETLSHCEADPLAMLGNLPKGYVVAGRVFLANVPESMRTKFIEKMKDGLQKEAAQKDDESEANHAARKKFLDQFQDYATRISGDLDQVTMSWGLDRTAEKTYVDMSLTARPGTVTADEMDLAAKSETRLSGFHASSAAVNAGIAGPIPAAKQELAGSLIEVVRGKALSDIDKREPAEKQAGAKGVVNDAANLLQKIIKGGHVDGAATVLLSPKAATALIGGYIADGAALDKILHTIATAIIADHPEIDQFVKLDAEKSRNVTFHKITFPIPGDADNRDAVVQMIGENLDIVIGVGKETAYLAAGRDALPALKKAIEASARGGAKPVQPLGISLAVKPVVSTTAEVGKPEDRPKAAWANEELKKLPGKDHVSLSVQPISNGVQVHLEVEQGLVRLLGRAVITKMQPSDN